MNDRPFFTDTATFFQGLQYLKPNALTQRMKHLSAVLFLIVLSTAVLQAQETTPEEGYFTPEMAEPPTLRKTLKRKEMENRIEHMKVRSRWYIGADLYGRSDMSTLENNYRYLFKSSNSNTIDFSFSGQVGWIFREQFALEGGYARSQIHNTAVLNTTNKGGFRFANDGNAFFLRSKFLVEFEKMGLRRSGLWIGGGAWAVPGSGGERDPKAYIIYHYDNRGSSDTTYISSETTISSNWTYGLELSAEFAFKVNEWSDMAIFLRRHWGYGTAISTELTFADNKRVIDTGFIKSDGTGWNFGVSFRFMTGIKRGEFKGQKPDAEFITPYSSKAER